MGNANDWTADSVIETSTADARSYIKRNTARLGAMLAAADILDQIKELAPSLKWAPAIETHYGEEADASIDLWLDADASPSFVRQLVKALGVPMARKAREHSGAGLSVVFVHNRIRVTIYGYVPDTCKVEYEDVLIPAMPARTERRAKVVCLPPTGDVTAYAL